MRVLTSRQMKELERRSLDFGLTYAMLMENAGQAAAHCVLAHGDVRGRRVVIPCADGNNGGDGLVVARALHEAGAEVTVILFAGAMRTDEAQAMLERLPAAVARLDYHSAPAAALHAIGGAHLIVDALFGTGFAGALRDPYRMVCRAMNGAVAPVVALDIPSGAACDSVDIDPDAVQAQLTVAFDSLKPVHRKAAGLCGQVVVVDIGIPDAARCAAQA